MKEVILTPEGYEKLKVEIEHLSTNKRREVADRIRIARGSEPKIWIASGCSSEATRR